MKTFAIALVLMLGLLFVGAPAAYAHSAPAPMREGCHKAMMQAKPQVQQESVVFVKVEKEAAQTPCHENCPSGGKMASQSGCCMSSCASITFISYAPVIGTAVTLGEPASAKLASAFASISPAGPQKPPKHS